MRHTFKDRLRKTSAREEMINAIMGHAPNKPDYGYIDLAAKLEVMSSWRSRNPHVALVA